MVRLSAIEDFLSQHSIAVVGVSRSQHKFGTMVFKDLKERKYDAIPVNPSAEELYGMKCYPTVTELPPTVTAAVFIVPPEQATEGVRQAIARGIRRLWLQPGAESEEAIAHGVREGIDVIHGECILMFLKDTGFIHKLHKGLHKLTGSLPR